MIFIKYLEDHAVFSETLTTIPFPAKIADITGPRRLWN